VFTPLLIRLTMKSFLVRQFMSQPVIGIGPHAKVTEAHQLMVEKRIRRLPVLDIANDNKLIGIITLLDASEARPPGSENLRPTALHVSISLMRVGEVMTHNPITISPDATILDAARLMARHKISGLPVVEHDSVVGMLTESDAFRAIVQAADEEARQTAMPGMST
jgi:CBS domain-containing protein